MALMHRQREAFRAKFGRDPGPSDPLFFDPGADTPVEMDMQSALLAAMSKANLPPEFAYAFKKTGLLGLSADKRHWSKKDIAEWNAAVDEGRAIDAARKRPDAPDPRDWSTEIPELITSPFTRQDLLQVVEITEVVAPIEARGMKVVTRIELAAVFVASALEHAYRAGLDSDKPSEAPEYVDECATLVMRRAMEIYANDRA